MARRMLIDASHREETRVVVVDGNRVEEFDFETAFKKQISGNIYLAKVTRVEPSLQAAFIEYGGNRHGFLAFNEIHPDYYQIPVADRRALIDAERREDAEEEEAASRRQGNGNGHGGGDEDDEGVETVGAEDAFEETTRKRPRQRPYKIQEVIRRRQILLVQVVKEERGNKGAALTTYISLAGRYCVLMPNTGKGGGISRKITNAPDRKRLKAIAEELEIPEGMGLIIRTAGANRTKAEIKRDYEYLLRLWDTIRTDTLQSTAPALVHEEGSLIKRAIRDLYSKDIGEVLVQGDDGYREAKDFMKMLTPSHAKNVKQYKDRVPLLTRYRVESQLDSLMVPQVQLRSGGYLVINATEALVAIDVNSGKSTREHSIEDTALKTNLEAAEEVARQLRLRDLAGLIVIDFIDMEESKNNRAVERKLKECLKNDRARIQVGRISSFGLLEMSRQRLRPSVIETSSSPCPHCHGTGHIRSVDSIALHILRRAEEEGVQGQAAELLLRAPVEVANFILNRKREWVNEIEQRYELALLVEGVEELTVPHYELERTRLKADGKAIDLAVPEMLETSSEEAGIPDEDEEQEEDAVRADGGDDEGRKKRRRRRRRKPKGGEAAADTAATDGESGVGAEDGADESAEDDDDGEERADEEAASGEEKPRKRRRGRRGGRRRRKTEGGADEAATEVPAGESAPAKAAAAPEVIVESRETLGEAVDVGLGSDLEAAPQAEAEPAAEASAETPVATRPPAETAEETPKPKARRTRKPRKAAAEGEEAAPAAAEAATASDAEAPAKPARPRTRKRKTAEPSGAPAAEADTVTATASEPAVAAETAAGPDGQAGIATEHEPEVEPEDVSAMAGASEGTEQQEAPKPARRGWWRTRFLRQDT
ncbi:Rne/Rng family ribonuclease [Futiania mangrovi]|uniref:Ribonuclease E n=1 Tax=Futiania mangrovi TaxID=2959716 RepID=A0A9J6PHX4_9PROT|nr:ribonuclease E/G [Futiania mangrovii]MCP1335682.1 Rne/Rng family ribonuclease [Futiania mangrovii]